MKGERAQSPNGEWPRITLVTPSFNQGRFLEETIRSVLDQGYPNLEYMVFDGGSVDGSVGILERYSNRLTYWESNRDEGQSHAIEKGLARATGVIANWLNSDDLLLPGSLHRVAAAYRETGADLIVGEDNHFATDATNPIRRFRPSGYEFPECLRFWTGKFRYHQPCTFFRLEIYQKVGGIDRSLKFLMDYDLYCRMLGVKGVLVAVVPEVISAFRLHQESKTETAKAGFLEEQRRVSKRYWASGGFAERAEASKMDIYSSRCTVYQAASALRRMDLLETIRSVGVAIGYAAKGLL
jgi:glycosyltransferase involved in cell wall biosynthesis